VHAATDELKLPNLGEASTSLFSAEYEHRLGRAWLRVFRSQVATVNDPLLFAYLEDLIFRLVTHSELQDRRIELVVVDNPTINAFAVPGGVIGIHNGLLLHAQTEDELATVIAHEIAHLSQRHFSRRLEFAKTSAAPDPCRHARGLCADGGGRQRCGHGRNHRRPGRGAGFGIALLAQQRGRGRPRGHADHGRCREWIRTPPPRCSSACCRHRATPRATAFRSFCARTRCRRTASPTRATGRASTRNRSAPRSWTIS
jgi:hypothetical protein